MKNLKLFSCILFYMFILTACTIKRQTHNNLEGLTNKPNWETYDDMEPLKDLLIRVDSIKYNHKVSDIAWGNVISFAYFDLYVSMNRQTTSRPFYDTNFKHEYRAQMVKINLFVSDILSDSAIANFKKEVLDENIEKGYICKNSCLYINDYNNRDSYFILNLLNKRAYKLTQDAENSKYTYRSLIPFVSNGALQGIQLITKNGAYSIGDCLMF
jgi:hypothetical protein